MPSDRCTVISVPLAGFAAATASAFDIATLTLQTAQSQLKASGVNRYQGAMTTVTKVVSPGRPTCTEATNRCELGFNLAVLRNEPVTT